jgi:hypothetical protein
MPSIVRDAWSAWSAWLERDVDARPLDSFRRAFAGIWLLYDGFDLALSGTSLCAHWPSTVIEGAPLGLQLIQLGLVLSQSALFAGRWIPAVAVAACALRLLEQFLYFGLNDFLYYSVTVAWLAFAAPHAGRDDEKHRRCVPAWVRDGLLIQTGWIYLASALLKMNPAFISCEHFWVRHAYQATVLHWPYPGFLRVWLSSLRVNAALAWVTVISEAALGALLWLRRGRPLALALALGIHLFAALAVNVFFFGASLLAQVWLLFPRDRPVSARPP